MPQRVLMPEGLLTTRDRQGPTSVTLGDNIYERVSLSLYNSIKGDPDGAVRSLLRPESLAPSQSQTIADQYAGGERKGIVAGLIRTATNPLVLVGAALAYKWPILNPKALAKIPEQFANYGKWIPAPLRGLLGMNEIFVKTNIPKLSAQITRQSVNFIDTHFNNLTEAIVRHRRITGRELTAVDQRRLGALADRFWTRPDTIKRINQQIKFRNKGLTTKIDLINASQFANIKAKPFDNILLDAFNNTTTSIRTFFDKNPELVGGVRKSLKKQGLPSDSADKWLTQGFLPHVSHLDSRAVGKVKREFVEKILQDPNVGRLTPEQMAQRISVSQAQKIPGSKALAKRTDVLIPEFKDLEILGGVDPKALKSLELLKDARIQAGKGAGSYSLNFSPVVQRYANKVSRLVGWEQGGAGTGFIKEINAVRKAELELVSKGAGGTPQTELLLNHYLPSALGLPNFEQSMRSLEWNGLRQYSHKVLQNTKLKQAIGPGAHKALSNMINAGGGKALSGDNVAGYFYLSALGGNVGSAFQNLLQPLLTTAPILGVRATLKGMGQVITKMPQVVSLMGKGMTQQKALAKVFKEFESRALDVTPIYSEALGDSAAVARGTNILNTSQRGLVRSAKRSLMGLFSSTELFNRLSTFEAARIAGRGSGMAVAEAGDFAQGVVNVTQLWAGNAALPSATLNWATPLRQFTTFPLKLAGFLGASALNVGGPGSPFNPGTLGRAIAYSTAAYEMIKAGTGADISRSLLFGAVPAAEEDGPFAPLPVVPPILSLAGGGVLDLARGEFKETRKNLPLLVPGGLQAARFAQADILPNEIATFLGRSSFDFKRRTPDGRVPNFTKEWTTNWICRSNRGLLQDHWGAGRLRWRV